MSCYLFIFFIIGPASHFLMIFPQMVSLFQERFGRMDSA